ncbi:endospore germination permease [Bacillus sp. DX1.1]|uniref:GerAB/ArcD/ProY family transporter n=1 Tax=unclassified Bacillus (in: firmicutes) TaxID=185979 RepID=UPI002570F328|nr:MULTISPECIES: endospore germination permease [unclassified Bacillus (in: firmicutes)]MDM5154509.1 endospore germination permease [Bacillus sp. DX1.1]WJE83407.1 endospore germination permease [Bacillus sp. DX3.1]
MEKGKISSFQMALMIVPTIIATAILIVPSITGKFAGRDMWISPILASLNGFFTAFLMYRLHKIYPNKTFIQYSEHIIGRIPGKVLGFVYLFFFLHTCGSICREYADFVIGSFLPKTPMIVVLGSIIFVCAFAVRGGVEVIGRVAQLLIPLFILPLFLLILLLSDLKPVNMLPIMEHGIMPSVMGAAVPQGWFAEIFMISMLLPFLTDREKGMKWSVFSVIVAMLTLTYTNIMGILHFGNSVISYAYPLFSAFRYISIAGFFEHLESVVITFWILGVFVKISVFYYALVLGTAQWLQCSNYRPIVFPLGFLLMLFGIWVASAEQEMTRFLGEVFPFYGALMFTLIPLLLLLIAIIHKKWKDKSYTIKE